MVRGRDFRAVDVAKTVRMSLEAHWIGKHPLVAPPWLKALERVPPSELLTRPVAVQHRPPSRKATKPKNIYKPQRMVFEEDHLRRDFYKDHPWELARPRVILEIDGKDSWYCDWSKGLRQPGIPLSGESVVQRQMWLMHNPSTKTIIQRNPNDPTNRTETVIHRGPLSKREAYDEVRREFYALRQEEEVERRIAREEAMMVGAYFGKSRLQVGNRLEDVEFERWKSWAAAENAMLEAQRASATTSYSTTSTEGDGQGDIEAALDEVASEAVPA